MNSIARKVVEYIRQHEETSYVELERVFEENGFEYKGEFEIYSATHEKVVFWVGWNRKAIELLNDLQQRGLIVKTFVQPVLYYIDGKVLDLPIVKCYQEYDSPHWLPIGFTAT